jgi:hypothetical protein
MTAARNSVPDRASAWLLTVAAWGAIAGLWPALAAGEDADRAYSFKWVRRDGKTYYTQTEGVLAEALRGDLAGASEVVFAVRADGRDGHWYANFGHHICDPDQPKYGGKGGKLCVVDLRSGEGRTLVDDPAGDVRDPAVHYDGRTILFSYRKGGTDDYHLYTIGSDGEGLRQLTSGPWNDIEACWLPDGGIMFCSTRCMRWVPCWYTQVALMYRCNADGSDITQISFGVETENTPWPLPDGRVAYTRWEYVDRSQNHHHGLWTINPDGTGVELLYDNRGTMNLYIDAKPIPGSDEIVTIVSPLHGQQEHRGRLAILDPSQAPDAERALRFLDRGYPGETKSRRGGKWRDPYPVSKRCFLAASDRMLAVMNARGDYEIAWELPEDVPAELNLHEPRLLRPRPRERVIPHVEPSPDGMATVTVMDVTIGRNMEGIERGDIERLLIMEELPRPGANDMDADIISYAGKNYILHRILGTVPVEADGSAHFKLPAGRPVFFYALDGNGIAAKTMPSYISAMSGEQVACVGCHEQKGHVPDVALRRKPTAALKRPPSRIAPVEGVPEIFDYVRDIQPIWDKHCISCHNYDKHAGDVLLVGDLTPSWTISYWSIKRARGDRKFTGLINNHPGYEPDPYSAASGSSRLIEVLRKGHKDAKLSDVEMRRIQRWADAGTTFAGTYAALNDIGKHRQIHLTEKRDAEYNRACEPAGEVIQRRCAGCHDKRVKRGAQADVLFGEYRNVAHRFNITRPEKSLLLLAPLAKEAGGLEMCRKTDDSPAGAPPGPVFASTDDPDYATLRELVGIVLERHTRRRWFHAGHVPADWYLREMKRFGALPGDYDPTGPDALVGYEIDRRYFHILYRMGPGPTPCE